MKKIMFYNLGPLETAKTIVGGCYKFGIKSLLMWKGTTMTSVIEYEDEEREKERYMIQKVGDRDNPSLSVKDYAFCINANPMSDRQQMVVEILGK